MVPPRRVADVCFDVHALFAEGEPDSSLAPLLHTVALMTLQRFDRLPPHRQSLAVIATNIAGALARLAGCDRRLDGIMSAWRFGERANGQPYDPHRIRTAVQLTTALRPIEPRAFMQGVAEYALGIDLARRGLPQTFALLAYRVLQPPPWAAFLECGGMQSAFMWNMAALLGTFSPPAAPAVRFTVADCDRRQEALVRMLAALSPWPVPISIADSFSACARSPLRFDRIVAIADTAADGYLDTCWQLLHPGGKALVALPAAHLERWWSTQLHDALARDRIEAVLEWSPSEQSQHGWVIVLLRTTAPIHLRRRTLVGTLQGELSVERIEELCDSLAHGSIEHGWLQWHVQKSSAAVAATSLRDATPALPTLAHLLERYSERGIDVSILTVGNNGSLRFDDRITSADTLRTAIRSLHGSRTHEMRYSYTLYQWWHRIRPMLGHYGRMVWQTVEQSLVEQLSCVPSISRATARALALQWWQRVEPDMWAVEQIGPRSVVESIIGSVERKLRSYGVKLWKQLDERERIVLDACTPELSHRVRSEIRQQAHQHQRSLQQLDERIATLQSTLNTYRTRMSQLHAQAKAHDVPHDAPELIDSTMPLQNELSVLLKEMVVVQSELKMLQQNRQLLQTPSTEDWFSPVVARCTAQLLPALQAVRRSLSDEQSWALLVLLWEEELHTLADAVWESVVESIVADVEQVWRAQTTLTAASHKERYAHPR
jgi:hypothetical protein